MEYRLLQRGKEAQPKTSLPGRILDWMKEGYGVANEHQVAYQFEVTPEESRKALDSLVKAGFLSQEEEDSGPSLEEAIGF